MLFEPMTSQSSKQEELAMLVNFALLYKEGSYLDNFFTIDLIRWLQVQMDNDFSADLYHAYVQMCMIAREAGTKLALAEERDNFMTERHAQEVQDLSEEIESLEKKLFQWAQEATTCKERVGRQNELISQLQSENWVQKQAINALKAEIYDLRVDAQNNE